jgi:hypothetical protein
MPSPYHLKARVEITIRESSPRLLAYLKRIASAKKGVWMETNPITRTGQESPSPQKQIQPANEQKQKVGGMKENDANGTKIGQPREDVIAMGDYNSSINGGHNSVIGKKEESPSGVSSPLALNTLAEEVNLIKSGRGV